MNIKVGELRHRIVFQKLCDTENEVHETVQEYKGYKSAWASIEPLKGREYFEAQAAGLKMVNKILIRYIPGIEMDMIIKFGDRLYQILDVINIQERNEFLMIMCTEKVITPPDQEGEANDHQT